MYRYTHMNRHTMRKVRKLIQPGLQDTAQLDEVGDSLVCYSVQAIVVHSVFQVPNTRVTSLSSAVTHTLSVNLERSYSLPLFSVL